MNRRQFLNLTLALPLSQFFITYCSAAERKPNIIFILVDDLGWKDVGFMGSTYYETPNIDRLAGQGMIFTNAYSNGPNCAPSRASLLTGQYTPRHGIYTVGSSERGKASLRKLIPVQNKTILPAEKITLAEILKPAGYLAASMGKWHLGDDPETGPLGQGFDVNIAGNHAGHPRSYFSPYHNQNLSDGPAGEYLTDRLTLEALKFIEKNRENTFFLYLPHYAVHSPLQAKKKLIAKYQNKPGSSGQNNPVYAAMVESVDQGVGQILGKLDQLDLAKNTVVIFFSDNGGVRTTTSMAPLRGGKGMLYEGGIRVPMIVRWPGHIRPGTKCDVPVTGIDFFPTISVIAGGKTPDNQILDGVNILPLFAGKKSLSRQALFWHFPAYLQGKAEGARDPYFRTRPGAAVRMGDWKLIEYFEDAALELYNLKNDIGEKTNLAEEMPEKVEELLQVMLAWRKKVGAPVPTELNPKFNPDASGKVAR